LLDQVAAAVEGTAFALWAARDPLAYPIANVVHVLGLALLLGPVLLMELKLLGAFPELPLEPFVRALRPFAVAGLLMLLLSGPVLFAADATALAVSGTFRLKLVLVGLGLANALAFTRVDAGEAPGPVARAMALASLVLWTGAAMAGRWIAYAG
jgi:hypothetical protein